MLVYYQLGPWEQASIQFELEYLNFQTGKLI